MEGNLHLPIEFFLVSKEMINQLDFNEITLNTDLIGVFLCQSGETEAEIDSRHYHIKRREMFFYTPSFHVRIISMSDDFYGLGVRTDYGFALPLINKVIDVRSQLLFRNEPCISLTESQYLNVEQLMTSLADRIEMESRVSHDVLHDTILSELIKSLGATLMYEIVDIFFTSHPVQSIVQDRADEIVQNFLISLYRHFRTCHDVAYYAREQCLSSSYFSSIIKMRTGRSASHWIVEMILLDARQMLLYSNVSIKEIAVRLNFPTQSFFGKFFKQHVGLSPKEFRKRHLVVK